MEAANVQPNRVRTAVQRHTWLDFCLLESATTVPMEQKRISPWRLWLMYFGYSWLSKLILHHFKIWMERWNTAALFHSDVSTVPKQTCSVWFSFYFCPQVTYQRLIAAYCENGDIEGARWANLLFCSSTYYESFLNRLWFCHFFPHLIFFSAFSAPYWVSWRAKIYPSLMLFSTPWWQAMLVQGEPHCSCSCSTLYLMAHNKCWCWNH